MRIERDVTQVPCRLAHVSGWSDAEQVYVCPFDPSLLLLRAAHHVGVLALSSEHPLASHGYWQPHRRLTTACWLPGSGATSASFAVGDAASTVRLTASPSSTETTSPSEGGANDASDRTTTIVVDRASLVASARHWGTPSAASPSSPQKIRTLLPISANGHYLLAQRSTGMRRCVTPDGVTGPAEETEHLEGSGFSAATVWVVAVERQSSWSTRLPCAAARDDEVPVLMPLLPSQGVATVSELPRFAVCSSQAITVCQGPSLTHTVSFVFASPSARSAAAAATSSEVLQLFEPDAGSAHSYTALVRQQQGTRSAVWLASWDARYPSSPTWWASLDSAEGPRIAGTSYQVCPLPVTRGAFAVAMHEAAADAPRRARLCTVRAPVDVIGASSPRQPPACIDVKPCQLNLDSLFSCSAPTITAPAASSTATVQQQERPHTRTLPHAMSYVDNALTLVEFTL